MAQTVKVMPIRPLNGVFSELQPEIGKIYVGRFYPGERNIPPFCTIEVKGKTIVMRKGEYEIIGSLY